MGGADHDDGEHILVENGQLRFPLHEGGWKPPIKSSILTVTAGIKMVKRLDEKTEGWPDHIGWRLSQASRNWQAEFTAAMREAGHGWLTEARAGLLGHIGLRGVRQADLVERSGTTKQAVQQLLDGLEGEGIVMRVADPSDRRSRVVRYTEKGLAAMRDGNRLKAAIDDRYRKRLGAGRFEELVRLLREMGDRPAGE